MQNIKINFKNKLFNLVILLPIFWTFTGMFLYPNGKKAIVALILISAITSIFLYGFKNISSNLKYNKLLWLLAAFSVFAIAADFYYGYSSSQLRAFISLYVYLSIFPTQLNSKINLRVLTVLGAATSLIYLLIQMLVYNNYGRMWNINPIPYTTFVASIAIISIYFLLHSNTFKQRTLWLVTFMATLAPLFYSQARGLWLALTIAILLLAIKSVINNKKSIFLLIALLPIIAISSYSMSGKLIQRFERTKIEIHQIMNGNLNTSIGLRLQLWQAAIYLTGDSPIIGLGGSHMERKKELAEQNIISPSIIHFSHYHNQFLNALVKYGVIGLSLLLCSIFLPVYYFFKNDSKYKWPGFLTVLIFVIASLTDVPFQHAQPLIFYFVVMYITFCTDAPTPLTKREIQ
jgi:O-antigen ligase